MLPRGGEGVGLPSDAMLQFALLPLIIGFGSTQAFLADSGSRKVTKPYPLDFPVILSVMITASRISPNCSKYLRMSSVGVSQANPPTNTFVNVVSPNGDR